ncbi:glycosyltransferase family 1 protein [Neobacillus notoginsengisoli]|uniref:Glycosyltransferase family 1 protein n=1 Tax=Neobacillus notoginsengisoli TaxID=1578198 RepID=A0A417YQY5_9BACI|nr:glycosyltransferase [Neobacillus notoginsengisoli]RHW37271.1 glycosyltransferase family 1 protein [Neobacillus notoginsengisoli]
MDTVLLYYPFQLAENPNSGSKLRPKKMYEAFLEWGKENNVEILLLSGSSKDRANLFKTWKNEGKLDSLLFCYMENQTIPFWLTDAGHIPKQPLVDSAVMTFLKKKNVPVGVFYRDVYWKFDELYPLKGAKKALMQLIYRLEEKFYEKYCKVVFLPSDAMGSFVDIRLPKVSLPPGGTDLIPRTIEDGDTSNLPQGIYVGGINNEDYGLFLLLEGLELVNREKQVCRLTVVCREDEYLKLPPEKKERLQNEGVTVLHISGDKLTALYKEMDFAFIPRYKSTYNDFSVPVKLVEYLSNGLPVLATNCDAQKEIIEGGGYGLICEDNPASMADTISKMINGKQRYREHIKETFIKNHSWLARVEKVREALIGGGKA